MIKNERYNYKLNYFVMADFFLVTGKEMNKNIILLYIVFIGPFFIALFLYGFFPLVNYHNTKATQDNIPKSIENVR